jgi:hypothetical protein
MNERKKERKKKKEKERKKENNTASYLSWKGPSTDGK